MPKKPNIDTAKIKQFFLEKGERVGLALTSGISLLLLVFGFVGISTKPPAAAGSSTWGAAFGDLAKVSEQKLRDSRPPDPPKEDPVPLDPKDLVAKPTNYASLISVKYERNDQRRNPSIVSIATQNSDKDRQVQVDYVLGPTLKYDVDFNTQKITLIDKQPLKILDPKRMVVVTAIFPYSDQLKQFARALHVKGPEELQDDLPQFLGLNIYRGEVAGDGKEDINGVRLYEYDLEQKKTVVHQPLDHFFRSMVIDTENVGTLGHYFGQNMVTPLPLLATVGPHTAGKYPKIELTDIKLGEDTEDVPAQAKTPPTKGLGLPTPTRMQGLPQKGGGQPAASGAPKEGGRETKMLWSKALTDSDLLARLKGNYNVFDPMAAPLTAPDEKGGRLGPNLNPLRQPGKGMRPSTPFNPSQPRGMTPTEGPSDKLLVRFIDIDLEVGKTYRYWVQVRVANPNLDNPNVIAIGLAKVKELSSELTPTPPITVPREIYYYAIDMQPDSPQKPISHQVPGGVDLRDRPSDIVAPVQIHRWINTLEEPGGLRHVIGDWVIAERLLIKRGQPLGRQVLVEVPEWDARREQFTLGASTAKHKALPFIPVDFLVEGKPAPLLVDFQGGGHDKYKPKKTTSTIGMTDHAALELLVLDADGKLIVHSSQEDAPDPLRLEHYNRWSRRVTTVRESTDNRPTAPPGRPGGFPGIRNR